MALFMASTAMGRVLRPDPLLYSVSPTPTMQYLSLRLLVNSNSSSPTAMAAGAPVYRASRTPGNIIKKSNYPVASSSTAGFVTVRHPFRI